MALPAALLSEPQPGCKTGRAARLLIPCVQCCHRNAWVFERGFLSCRSWMRWRGIWSQPGIRPLLTQCEDRRKRVWAWGGGPGPTLLEVYAVQMYHLRCQQSANSCTCTDMPLFCQHVHGHCTVGATSASKSINGRAILINLSARRSRPDACCAYRTVRSDHWPRMQRPQRWLTYVSNCSSSLQSGTMFARNLKPCVGRAHSVTCD